MEAADDVAVVRAATEEVEQRCWVVETHQMALAVRTVMMRAHMTKMKTELSRNELLLCMFMNRVLENL